MRDRDDPRPALSQDELARRHEQRAREAQERREAQAREAAERERRVRWMTDKALASAGGLFMVTGLYFLTVAPSVGGEFREVVNLQRLTMGETFTIVGAIFAAAGLRPRGKD